MTVRERTRTAGSARQDRRVEPRLLAGRIVGICVLLAGGVVLVGVGWTALRRPPAPPPLVAVAPPYVPLPEPPPPPPTAGELLLAAMRHEALTYGALEGRALDDALDVWARDAVDVPYGLLERNPEAHLGDPVVFSGRVLEIRDLPGGGTFLRVGTGSYGSDPLWIETFVAPSEDIIADTRVRVYGYLSGPHSYTSEAGWNITIPSVIGLAVVRRR